MTTTQREATNGRVPTDRHEVLAALATVERSRSSSRWPWLGAGLVVGFAAAVAILAYLERDDAPATEAEEVALSTAAVETRDLTEEIEWSATLGYGDPATTTGAGGTVTSIADAGTIVVRGDVVATIDANPVVVFYGDVPFWRSMGEGDEGNDVFLLETNLAALGYDPDQTVDIDEVFTANTAAMVERWQEDIGVEPTGVVDPGAAVMATGPSAVSEPAAVGSAASGPLVTLAPRTSVVDVVAAADGVVSDLAPEGTAIEEGTVLFVVADVPVVATLDSAAATADEADTEADAAIDVMMVVVPAGHSVGSLHVEEGALVTGGGPVLTTARSELQVSLTVDVAEADEFSIGQAVLIELADETTVDGAVVAVSDVIRPTTNQDTPTVDVIVAVVGADDADADVVEGPVTVISTGSEVLGATVVPTRALVSVIEGGFAVEVVNDDGTVTLTGVELGVFDDGVVEVTNGAVVVGQTVVVPS
ncbi:MAG: peptidoglycan-binding protein [Actinomycetota bacterium]